MSDKAFDGGETKTRTFISGGDAESGNLAIPLNAITVQTNLDWQLALRDDFRRHS